MADRIGPHAIPDEATFEHVYKQNRDRLQHAIAGMVRDRERAEDVAATAFQTAWEKRTQFRGESSLGTWVHAIGRNAARRTWRDARTAREESLDRLENSRIGIADRVFERLEQQELRAQLWKSLERIPAKCRRLLVEHYLEGHSTSAIARRERVPVGTIASRLFKARQLLRDAWEAPGAQEGRVPDHPVKKIAEQALKRLAEELREGRSEALNTYLAAMARFHRYSWNNSLLIHTQRPTATHVAGYQTWRELGRWVRRGEKAIAIYAPIRRKATDEERSASEQTAARRVRAPTAIGFRAAYVFDVEQTEGRPLPAFAQATGDPGLFTAKLKAFAAERGVAVAYAARGELGHAQGVSSGGRIQLAAGLAPAEEFSVLAHELAHELLHHGSNRQEFSTVVRETQAEAVAYVVSSGIGLQTNRAAADYITLYNGNEKMLADSLAAIQETASRILNELVPQERARSLSGGTPEMADRSTSESPQERPSEPARESSESPSWEH